MKLDKTNINTNFGITNRASKVITLAALKKVPALAEFADDICWGTKLNQNPLRLMDIFDRRQYYFGDKVSRGISPHPNACNVYEDLVLTSFIDIQYGDTALGMQRIGTALRVLQDMADPLHTEKNAYKKMFHFRRHYDYEAIMDSLIRGKKFSKRIDESEASENLFDLFGDTYSYSSKLPNPLASKNRNARAKIIDGVVEKAYESSVGFLKRIENLYDHFTSSSVDVFPDELGQSRFFQIFGEK